MNRKDIKAGFVVLVIVLIISLGIGCAAPAPSPTPTPKPTPTPTPTLEVIELVYSSFQPQTHTIHSAVEDPWLDLIEKETGGRVKFIRNYASALVKQPGAHDAVTSGLADIAHILYVGSYPLRWPFFEAMRFPGITSLPIRGSAIWWKLMQEFPEYWEHTNEVKFIGTRMNTTGTTIQTVPQVRTLEDMKGLSLISAGGFLAKKLEAFGATPVTIPPSESYEAIERGMADGTLYTHDTLKSRNLVDFIQWGLNVAISFGGPQMGMNLDTWNSLPKDIQAVFDKYGGEFYADFADRAQYGPDGAIQTSIDWLVKEKGVTIYDLPPAEAARWQAKSDTVREEFITWAEGKGVPRERMVAFFDRWVELSQDPAYNTIK